MAVISSYFFIFAVLNNIVKGKSLHIPIIQILCLPCIYNHSSCQLSDYYIVARIGHTGKNPNQPILINLLHFMALAINLIN